MRLAVHFGQSDGAPRRSLANVVYTTPLAPRRLCVLHITHESAAIAWEAAPASPTRMDYEVHVRPRAGPEGSPAPFSIVYVGGESRFTIPALTAASAYEVTVRARNVGGSSAFADKQTFVTAKRVGSVKFPPMFAWAGLGAKDAEPKDKRALLRVKLDDGSWSKLGDGTAGLTALRAQAKTVHGMFHPKRRPYTPERAHMEGLVPPASALGTRTPAGGGKQGDLGSAQAAAWGWGLGSDAWADSKPQTRTPLLPRPQTTHGFRRTGEDQRQSEHAPLAGQRPASRQ